MTDTPDRSLDLLMNPRKRAADSPSARSGAASPAGGSGVTPADLSAAFGADRPGSRGLEALSEARATGPLARGGASSPARSERSSGAGVPRIAPIAFAAPFAPGGGSDGSADEEDCDEEDCDGEDCDEEEEEGSAGDASSDGGSSTAVAVARPMTRDEIVNAKKQCLYRLDRLEKHGVKLPRRHTINSDLAEMQSDLERVQRDRATDASVRFQKRALITVVSGMEWANSRFDPFDVHLDGWSENVHDNLDDYDEVMEELHQKYQGRGQMAPELKLLMMIVSSGFMFHMSHAFAKNVSRSMNDAMRNNPDLMRQFAAATAGEMRRDPAPPTAPAPVADGGGGMRGPRAPPGTGPPQAPLGVSPSRIEEVIQFNRELDEASGGVLPVDTGADPSLPSLPPARLADASSRPPVPAMTKAPPGPKTTGAMPEGIRAPIRRRPVEADPGDTDLIEIMSAASETSGGAGSVIGSAVSSSRRNGRTRRTLAL